MTVKISVLKESHPGERRVATVPSVIARLTKLGCTIRLQTGAGIAATFADATFQGVEWESDPTRLVGDADIVMAVNAPPLAIIEAMKPGAILVSFIQQDLDGEIVRALCDKRITSFAMERVPRISRAQAMDALTSQAALAGYYAPLLGAVHMPRILPMMTTAVGRSAPPKCS
jgi:NAD(P) transhydrogenase subunit alpha